MPLRKRERVPTDMQRYSAVLIIFAILLLLPGRAYSVEVGERAPDFALADLQDHTHRLSDYAGSVVLVNFWAGWCKECLVELPSLNSLYSRFSSQGLVVIGVSVDRKPEDAASAAKTAKIVFPILFDRKGEVFMKQYRVIGLPTSILVDRNGVVRETFIGSHDFLDKPVSDKIQAVLREKTNH